MGFFNKVGRWFDKNWDTVGTGLGYGVGAFLGQPAAGAAIGRSLIGQIGPEHQWNASTLAQEGLEGAAIGYGADKLQGAVRGGIKNVGSFLKAAPGIGAGVNTAATAGGGAAPQMSPVPNVNPNMGAPQMRSPDIPMDVPRTPPPDAGSIGVSIDRPRINAPHDYGSDLSKITPRTMDPMEKLMRDYMRNQYIGTGIQAYGAFAAGDAEREREQYEQKQREMRAQFLAPTIRKYSDRLMQAPNRY